MPNNVTSNRLPTSINATSKLPAIRLGMGTPERIRVLESSWAGILRGGDTISNEEGRWLQILVLGADASVGAKLKALIDRTPGLKITDSAKSIGFNDAFIAALGAAANPPVIQPPVVPPPVAPPTPPTPPTNPGTGVLPPSTGVGVRVDDGAIVATGHLGATGSVYKLSPAMASLVKSADERLDLAVLNREFNPNKARLAALKSPDFPEGNFTNASQAFEGKTFIPVKAAVAGLIGALAQKGAIPAAAVPGLIGALAGNQVSPGKFEGGVLSEERLYRSPAHLYAINGADKPADARVVLYGGSVGHAELDKLVHDVGEGAHPCRIIKQMVHFNDAAQGGSIEAIVKDGVSGSTHAGGFSSGFENGKPTAQRSDWPADYGALDDDHILYNATLIAVDFQDAANKPIPRDTLMAYKRNGDMFDCFAGIVTPFSTGDLDPRFTNYKFNPLEVHDRASMEKVAGTLLQLDRAKMLHDHGSFYCAEGQYSINNIAPNVLLKKSTHLDTPAGKLIEAFIAAPKYAGKDATYRHEHPEIGWQHLRDTNKIPATAYNDLERTGRLGAALDWIPEAVLPFKNYDPKNADGMVGTPMTVATMTHALLRTYLPREGIAEAIAQDITRAWGDAATPLPAKAAIRTLLGGAEPDSAAWKTALAKFSVQAANGLLLNLLSKPELKNQLLVQAGFDLLGDSAKGQEDRRWMAATYDKFVGALLSPDVVTQQDLDKTIDRFDDEFRNRTVTIKKFDPATRTYHEVEGTQMLYAAPQSLGFYARNPQLFDGQGYVYLAHALHANQGKAVP